MTFVNGVATFTLKNGESKTATGLPTELGYTVEETPVEGFTTEKTGYTGKISKTKSTAEFTNTHIVGNLLVTKRVAGTGASSITPFTFTVYLYTVDPATGKTVPLSGTYPVEIYNSGSGIGTVIGTATIINGIGSFQLCHNQSARVFGIPAGTTWEVKETENNGYAASAETPNKGVIGTTESISSWKNFRSTTPPIPRTGYGDGSTVKIGLFSSLGVFLASAIGSVVQKKSSTKKKKQGGSHATESK